jgi:hypothetical protein
MHHVQCVNADTAYSTSHRWYLCTDEMGGQEVWSFSNKEACTTCPTTSIDSWNWNSIPKARKTSLIAEQWYLRLSECGSEKRTLSEFEDATSSWMLSFAARNSLLEVLPSPCISHGPLSIPRTFDAMSAACCHRQEDSWLRNRRWGLRLTILQRVNIAELKASHEKAHATVLARWILDTLQLRYPTLYSSIRRQQLPSPNYFSPSFLSIFSNILLLHIITKMASTESDLVRCYDNRRVLYPNISLYWINNYG